MYIEERELCIILIEKFEYIQTLRIQTVKYIFLCFARTSEDKMLYKNKDYPQSKAFLMLTGLGFDSVK